MRLRRIGTGKPTILLDAGWGHWSTVWMRIQELLATQFQTVAFDRMGLGGSTRVGSDRHAFQIVDELQAALLAAQVAGPYVYVGHAIGAVHARIHARRDHRVQAMVLVEPIVETLAMQRVFSNYRYGLEKSYRRALRSARWGVIQPTAWLLGWPKFGRNLPSTGRRDLRRGYRRSVMQTVLDELDSCEQSMQQLAGVGSPAVPIHVLSAGRDWLFARRDGHENHVQVMHRKLASMSPVGFHSVVPNAGHNLHLEYPREVLSAVQGLVKKVC